MARPRAVGRIIMKPVWFIRKASGYTRCLLHQINGEIKMSNETTANFMARQMQAMACIRYKLGIYDRTKKVMDNRDNLLPADVMGLIGFLKYKNANGCDIYITQATGVDRALILVDDLNLSKVRQMEEFGAGPSCVVETSPGNLQAWISLGERPMPRAQRKIVASFFARRFGGDLASADAGHLGRLSGFTNRKPQHLKNGMYPYAVLRSNSGISAEKSDQIRRWAVTRELLEAQMPVETGTYQQETARRKFMVGINDPESFFVRCHDEWLRGRVQGKLPIDLSIGDYAVVCKMVLSGYRDRDIFNAMERHSPNISIRKKNHVSDYITRTIAAVRRKIRI
jgi:hypothetical protein